MRRPNPVRQQGFGLLVLVMIVAILAFSFVIGYAGVLTRRAANQLPLQQQAYINQTARALQSAWAANAAQFDDPGNLANTSATDVLTTAGVSLKYGAKAVLSNVFKNTAEGIAYRSMVVYLPSTSDTDNPPDLTAFTATGVFTSCANPNIPCAKRAYAVFSSLDLEREMATDTQQRLARVAQKAQSYFKARMLQDPERNVSVNYFRSPLGACQVLDQDLGCMDTYQPLAVATSSAGYSMTHMATALGLTSAELVTAWGQPLQASNLQDASTADTPYSMVFRAPNLAGSFYSLTAVQQF